MRERATLYAVSAPMCLTRCAVVATVFVASLIGLSTSVQAQVKLLDEGDKYSRFVQALRERGMTSVLRHYIDAHPPKDPVVKLEVDIEIAKADFQDNKKDVTERASAALLALDLYRQIIKTAPQNWNWKRPIWRTDMAEWAFEGVLALRYVYAGEFVEFGVTTIEQRTIFDQLAAENYASMEEAANELFLLQLNLPKRDDFNEEFVNTGRWQQIKDVYGNIKTPFRRAWTVLYATQMEVPQGHDKLEEAYDQLQQVANQTLNDSGKAQVQSLLGRIAATRGMAMLAKGGDAPADKDKKDAKKPAGPSRDAQKLIQAGVKHLDDAINIGKDYPVIAMVATLAKAKALNALGQGAQAISLLEPFSAVDPAKSNPMMLILLYDARVVMSGDKSHYNKLFQEPAAQPWKGEIQQYIAQREVKDPEQVDPLKDAPFVVFSSVDLLSQKGAASRVRGEIKEAEDLLAKASTILEQFLTREDLPPEIRQQAQEKKGHVDFEANQRNKAVEAWLKLAEEADLSKSDLKEAGARAAKNAFLASQELSIQFAKNEAIQELYGRALTALFTRYADTPFAQRNWYHMGMFQLKSTDYAAAAASFEKVKPEHSGAAEALYQLAFSYYKIWRSDAANEDAAAKAAQAAEKAIKALEGPAKNNPQLLYMQGDAVLIRGELLTGPLKQPVVARNALKDFDEKYNKDPENADFKRLMYSKRRLMINILVDLGRIDEARGEIEAFTKESPRDAGPIIQSVLLALNEQKETFRLANNPKWKELAKMGVDIGRYLRDWAANQPWIAEKPANMLYFDLVVARQYMEAEQFDEAAKLIESLAKQEIGKTDDGKPITAENHKDLIAMRLHLAKRLGKDDQVMTIAKDITFRVQDLDDPVYWEAQLAMAEVLDKRYDQMSPEDRKEKGAKLYRYILQLRAKNADMGGPITKGKLIRLSEKYKPES